MGCPGVASSQSSLAEGTGAGWREVERVTSEIPKLGSWPPGGPALCGETPEEDARGGRKCPWGREGGGGKPVCLEKKGIRDPGRGSLPSLTREEAVPDSPRLLGEQGRGPLASCPAIWRAGCWPRLPLGDSGPLPPQQPPLSLREAMGRWHHGDGQPNWAQANDSTLHPWGPERP